MTIDKIDELVNDRDCAKEIYKLHLEAQLELTHNIYDTYAEISLKEFEEYITELNEELNAKLKELE